MAVFTEKYKFKKPGQEDYYDIKDQNDNIDKIEAALNEKANKFKISTVFNKDTTDDNSTISLKTVSSNMSTRIDYNYTEIQIDSDHVELFKFPIDMNTFTHMSRFGCILDIEYDCVEMLDSSGNDTQRCTGKIMMAVSFTLYKGDGKISHEILSATSVEYNEKAYNNSTSGHGIFKNYHVPFNHIGMYQEAPDSMGVGWGTLALFFNPFIDHLPYKINVGVINPIVEGDRKFDYSTDSLIFPRTREKLHHQWKPVLMMCESYIIPHDKMVLTGIYTDSVGTFSTTIPCPYIVKNNSSSKDTASNLPCIKMIYMTYKDSNGFMTDLYPLMGYISNPIIDNTSAELQLQHVGRESIRFIGRVKERYYNKELLLIILW